MRLGQAAMEALRAEITGCLKPGDELVVACPVALKGDIFNISYSVRWLSSW